MHSKRGQTQSEGVEYGPGGLCMLLLCSWITHLLHPGGLCISAVPDARRRVCWCERRSLPVENRAQLILRLIIGPVIEKHWQNGFSLTGDNFLQVAQGQTEGCG